MSDPSIYRPYSRLVRVRIRDPRCEDGAVRCFEVPENNILLRCFQYIAPSVPYGPFCWNGDCENDRIRYRDGASGAWKSGLACQVLVKDGMELDEISPDLARVSHRPSRRPPAIRRTTRSPPRRPAAGRRPAG
jgi:hypothetical protein